MNSASPIPQAANPMATVDRPAVEDPLWPLPLTAFERFLLLDDRPAYPMVFYVELVFEGTPDRQAVDQAITMARARHPLLDARVAELQGRACWVPDDGQPLKVRWGSPHDTSPSPAGADTGIDLRREAGLRVWGREEGGDVALTFQFHHACCDGQGARRFIVDFLTGYVRQTAASADALPEWDALEPERLRSRGTFAVPTPQPDRPLPRGWEVVRNTFSFLRSAARIASPRTAETVPPGSAALPLIQKVTLDREQTQRLDSRVKQSAGTLNDAALAVLFQVLTDWNRRHGHASPRQRFRILMPTDLRDRGDKHLPAANRMGFAFPLRRARECGDMEALHFGISQETKYIKATRLGLDFVHGLELAQRVPGALPALLKLPGCMATAVLTNLDDPSRRFRRRVPMRDGCPVIGNLVLKQLVGTPPIRPGTRAGFGLSSIAGRLTISLQCDPYHFDARSAGELLHQYVNALQCWASANRPTGEPA